MSRLNRGQRIAVLAGLAFALWVFGHFVTDVFFNDGFVAYTPVNSGVNWTEVWQDAVQLVMWLVLTAVWALLAVRALRAERIRPDESDDA
jgi:uncharacterized membrane protein (DUF485 family)